MRQFFCRGAAVAGTARGAAPAGAARAEGSGGCDRREGQGPRGKKRNAAAAAKGIRDQALGIRTKRPLRPRKLGQLSHFVRSNSQ